MCVRDCVFSVVQCCGKDQFQKIVSIVRSRTRLTVSMKIVMKIKLLIVSKYYFIY